jgi:hypothetical protein
MWDPRRHRNLWTSTACYRDRFTYPFLWRRMGKWRYKSNILDLRTRRIWMVSFANHALYPYISSIGGSVRVWCWEVEKNFLARPGVGTSTVKLAACPYTDWVIQAPSIFVGYTFENMECSDWDSPSFPRHYSSGWALAFCTICLNSSLSRSWLVSE